jgi:tRNA threonylcarbamoyladenosine biosynthesis protein TsaB
MNLLALETSTHSGGVALYRDGELCFSETFTADRSHSAELFTVIERALAGGVRADQIVVGIGPGSYAGVRIAIAAGIGLSLASGAEMIGIPSIAALADGEYLAIGDARRGGYWIARVREGEVVDGPAVVLRNELEARLAQAGEPVFSSEALDFPGMEIRYPQVNLLARLGVAGRGIHSRGTLEPLYLREPHITQPKTGNEPRQ